MISIFRKNLIPQELFELPAFNALDEAIVQGHLYDAAMRCMYRVKNVTFEVTSFRVNQRQTRLISVNIRSFATSLI